MGTEFLTGVKPLGRVVDNPPSSKIEVKKE
jgi:hypothetical protein